MKNNNYRWSRWVKAVVPFLLVLVGRYAVWAQPQAQPVHLQLAVTPPYSTFLTDYQTGSNLMLTLLQRDLTRDGMEVYLSVELEGSGIKFKTLPSFRPASYLLLNPGGSVTLTNADIAEYFQTDALAFEGISKESFLTTGQQLPQGLYRLKIQAFSPLSGQAVSNQAMALMGIYKGQAPLINMPFNNKIIPANDLQTFTIQWTNRNSAAFNAANPASYRLQIWELPPTELDPNVVVNSNYPTIFDEYLTNTTYQYGPVDPALIPGRSYAIRVQAIDAAGRDLFVNNGFSQVTKFDYGGGCAAPLGLTAKTEGRNILVNWTAFGTKGYTLKYRRADQADTSFQEVLLNNFTLRDVTPSAEYIFQVATVCDGDRLSAYSKPFNIFSLPEGADNQANCGARAPKINISNQEPLPNLRVGEVFKAYDFEVKVTRLDKSDPAGYSGEGTTQIKMLGNINTVVTYQNIKINTDRQLIDGYVYFQQKPYVFSDEKVKQFKDDFQASTKDNSEPKTASPINIDLEGTVTGTSLSTDQKTVTISYTDDNGKTQTKELATGKDYKVTDKTGDVYLISKDGSVAKQGKVTSKPVTDGPNTLGGKSTQLFFKEGNTLVAFLPHPSQQFGFDASSMNSALASNYEQIGQEGTSNTYMVAWKSIPAGGTDLVKAKITSNPGNIPASDIQFKTNDGQAVSVTYDATAQEWNITLPSGLHRKDFSVYPFYKKDGQEILCGKLNVMPLDKKTVNVQLIPLKGFNAASIQATDIGAALNKIYAQANTVFNVALTATFDDPTVTQPLATQHGKLTEYSANQALLMQAYQRANGEAADNTLYLFLSPQAAVGGEAVKGHTPVNRSFGFLFNTTDQRTIAHEVAHGYPLALEHPFADASHGTDLANLLSYNTATQLNFLQWGLVHQPPVKLRTGQSDKAGQLVEGNYYYRPDGKVFKAPFSAIDNIPSQDILSDKYPNGAIYMFFKEDITYSAVIKGNKFFGYYPFGDETKPRLEPEITLPAKTTSVDVVYLRLNGKCKWERLTTKFNIPGSFDNSWPSILGNELATAIPLTGAKSMSNGVFPKCDEDVDKDPAAGTLGADFYKEYSFVAKEEHKIYIKRAANYINKLGPDLCKALYNQGQANKNTSYLTIWECMFMTYDKIAKKDVFSWEKAAATLKGYSEAVDMLNNKVFASNRELVQFVNANFVGGGGEQKVFFDAPFSVLIGDRRNQLLSLYKGKKAGDIVGRSNVSQPIEDKDVIRSLFRYTKSSEAKKVLDHLYQNNILVTVLESFDSYFYGGNSEFTDVINQLTRMVMTAYPPPSDVLNLDPQPYYNDKTYLIFDNAYLGNSNTESLDGINSKIDFTVQQSPVNSKVLFHVRIEPYKYMLLDFKRTTEIGGGKFLSDQSYCLPAIYVYFIFNQNTRAKLWKSAEIAFDVASLAIGVGGFTAALKAARLGTLAYESFELANDVIGLAVDAYEVELEQSYPKSLKAFKLYSLLYGLAKGGFLITGADESAKVLIGENYFGSKKIIKETTDGTKSHEFAEQLKANLETEMKPIVDEVQSFADLNRAKFDVSIRNSLDDEVVYKAGKNLTEDEIKALNAEIKSHPERAKEYNVNPDKVKEWKGKSGSGTPTANGTEWLLWSQYKKKTINGEEFAIVGDHYFSKNAVESMVPSGLGGSGITPQTVEGVLDNGESIVIGTQKRFNEGNVFVWTENNGEIVRQIRINKITSISDLRTDPHAIFGYVDSDLNALLIQNGWTKGQYGGTSDAVMYFKESTGGRSEIVFNYGGGIHSNGNTFKKPYYYKLEGPEFGRRIRVIDKQTYPADQFQQAIQKESFKLVDGPTGTVWKQ